jgi:hypothetical protein
MKTGKATILPLGPTTTTKPELLLIARMIEAAIAQLQQQPRQVVDEMILKAKEEYERSRK